MAGRHFILSLDNSQYELAGRSLRGITSVADLDGDKMVFSDFEAAVPQIATVDSGGKYAHAVLEKQLRESGEIEAGGRLIVLLARNRGQRTTELLYITTPPVHGVESELERDHEEYQYLLFPVQRLLSDALQALAPRRPIAIMLVSDRHVDVLVADKRALYAAFRISALRAGADAELLSHNLQNALQAVEREFNIQIQKFHCLHLLTPANVDFGWIEALADARNIGCKTPRRMKVKVDDEPYFSSVLGQLRGMKAGSSCSPRTVITNYYANQALPWAAAALLACCALALFVLLGRQQEAGRLSAEIAALSSQLDARLAGVPAGTPDYQPYLHIAGRLAYARSIPSLREVLGNVSSAAQDKATAIDEVQVDYQKDKVVVTLKGHTDKAQGSDSMAFYNRFISDLRTQGYALSKSDIDTETRQIDFKMRLDRPVGGSSA